MRRLDIGIASYGSPDKLDVTLSLLRAHCRTDWRCFVILNPHPDPEVDHAVNRVVQLQDDPRIRPVDMPANVGYAGAVNEIFRRAETEYISYCDNDAHVTTPGWDETMAGLLDRHHELGIVFPAGGAYPIDRGNYHEILWGCGFNWMTTRVAASDVRNFQATHFGLSGKKWFDDSLGHQEEVDYVTCLRLLGYKIASCPDVHVVHHATASSDPAAQERISRGVVRWVCKWERFFTGQVDGYHSPTVLRHELWPPSALYLEQYYQTVGLGQALNAEPQVMNIAGQEMDLIRVPRLKGFYRGRVI